MQWINLINVEGLTHLVKESFNRPQLIFKYSETCSLSEMMKIKLERAKAPGNVVFHFLDIWKYRPLSNKIAEDFHVHHESPQVLLIINGECVYDESHMDIRMDEIVAQAM
ncbi:MAG TPA: bacillithiol system redox-active protein YtxJ [Chitinophagaceae bacterium]|nr:bacillithiol system redox-active protein YtxJ [Chitinophagaceae bacterium]